MRTKKASFAARVLGYPALSDDSGLCAEALDGAPGVLSARYPGEDATDKERCTRLLEEMTGKTDRRAAFECVVSTAVPTGQALTYEARCEGVIAQAPSGDGGFGYDPIFYYPPLNKTFSEMNSDEKNSVSHRGKVFAEIRAEFDHIKVFVNFLNSAGKTF